VIQVSPTDVNDELTTFDARIVPVMLFASAATTIGAEPSKFTPFIVFPGDNFVAVAALPVVDPEEPVTFPVTFPVKLPETSPVTFPVNGPTKLPAVNCSCNSK